MAAIQFSNSAVPSVPRKTTVNLAMKENHQSTLLTLTVGLVLIALLAFAAAKFGIIDQQARLDAAQVSYNKISEENAALADNAERYGEVLREYMSVTNSGLPQNSEDENGDKKVDRRDILSVISSEIKDKCVIENLQITDNTVTLTMSGVTLGDVTKIMEAVEKNPTVEKTAVNSAKTDDGNQQSGDVLSDVSVTLYFKAEEAEK